MFLLWGFIFFDIVYFFKFYKVIFFCVKINDIYINIENDVCKK